MVGDYKKSPLITKKKKGVFMWSGIIQLFIDFMTPLGASFLEILSGVMPQGVITFLSDTGFNIYLFSDTGWFTESVPIIILILTIMFFIMFFFLLRLLYKGTKKFINMIFGVFRV